VNRLTTLFLGFFVTFLFAWLGLVIIPLISFGQLEPQVNPDTGESYPVVRSGLAERGKQVYQASGCIYCHSQQVRPASGGSDIERGWGPRRTVARDYMYDKPPLLGTSRTGPDLSNIGHRQPSAKWHHQHLYAPQSISPDSIMAPYRYLYETRRIQSAPSPDALELPAPYAPAPGYEVVPTEEAKALVAYLQSLDHTYALPEAPLPKE